MDTDEQKQPKPVTEQQQEKPVKIRKKPGRKPNPASPALRKAQNRAAQRAFRERKERHLRELEASLKQVREQRDKLSHENEQLKSENDILKSENWYLKGIVLSLQLVCFQHNLTIPQHGPHINEQTLAVMAQSIPEPIASYLDANSKSKLPNFSRSSYRYDSTGSIVITEDGIHTPCFHSSSSGSSSHYNNTDHIPDLSPVLSDTTEEKPIPRPVMLSEEPLTSNLAAIQALRMRLRLQAACARMNSLPFAIQPTLLQLTIPHDPRIDLIPTPHMRDRMILFRDQFDLDDCFRCLLRGSVFHGGDPAVAGNWELPKEFFEKFWFLTIDFSLQRTTNRWRRMQGLKELEPYYPPAESNKQVTVADISSFLGYELNKSSYPSSISSTSSNNSKPRSTDELFFSTPIQLTDGHQYYFNRLPKQQQPPDPFFSSSLDSWDTLMTPSQNHYQ